MGKTSRLRFEKHCTSNRTGFFGVIPESKTISEAEALLEQLDVLEELKRSIAKGPIGTEESTSP